MEFGFAQNKGNAQAVQDALNWYMWPFLLIHNFETAIFIRTFRMPKAEISR